MGRLRLGAIVTTVVAVVHLGTTAAEGPVDMSGSVVLVYSSELSGGIKPCSSCSLHPLGGLARRAGYFAREPGRPAAFIALEGGDLCGRRVENGVLELQVILSALEVMGYAAVGLGERDLALGADFLESVVSRTDVALLCGNVVTEDGRHLFPGHIVVDVPIGHETARIGIVGVIADMEGFRTRAEAGGFVIEDPVDAARRSLETVESTTDVQVVLYHGIQKGAEELVRQCPSIDLVLLTTHVLGVPKSLSEDGQPVRFVTGGREGKYLATVVLSRSSTGDIELHTFGYERLDENITIAAPIEALAETFYDAILIDKAHAVPLPDAQQPRLARPRRRR